MVVRYFEKCDSCLTFWILRIIHAPGEMIMLFNILALKNCLNVIHRKKMTAEKRIKLLIKEKTAIKQLSQKIRFYVMFFTFGFMKIVMNSMPNDQSVIIRKEQL